MKISIAATITLWAILQSLLLAVAVADATPESAEIDEALQNPALRGLVLGGNDGDNEILGGTNATTSEFAYFVELNARNASGGNSKRCGGVLISDDLVLTAANCCFDSSGSAADSPLSLA